LGPATLPSPEPPAMSMYSMTQICVSTAVAITHRSKTLLIRKLPLVSQFELRLPAPFTKPTQIAGTLEFWVSQTFNTSVTAYQTTKPVGPRPRGAGPPTHLASTTTTGAQRLETASMASTPQRPHFYRHRLPSDLYLKNY
jgi:hypothetical protein